MFARIDHVCVIVEDLDAAIAFYEDTYALEPAHRETMADQGVEAVMLDAGASHVELICPLGTETGVARFLATRGPGLHHVAYAVDDIEAALAQLRARGLRLIDETPRRGIGNSRVAFLHPATAGGVLTELVQAAAE